MNQAQNSQHQSVGSDTTFPTQAATNSNPFATDLKGEFTSNFGTNANTVSQIFKDGGFGSENRTKYIMIGVAVVFLAVVAFVVYPKLTSTEDEFAVAEETAAETTDAAATDTATTDGVAAEEAAPEAATTEAAATDAAPMDAAVGSEAAPVDGSIALSSPENGASASYDETQSPMQFSWAAEGTSTIVFSRDPNMATTFRRVTASGSYAFHPYPGTWYWRVEANGGASEIRSFSVSSPARRNVAVSEPAGGSAVSGNGGVVRWQGDAGVSYYRVEMVPAGSDWSSPAYRFATSGSEAQLNGVAPGSYEMRVGALSKVSGRWEYTAPRPVSVQ